MPKIKKPTSKTARRSVGLMIKRLRILKEHLRRMDNLEHNRSSRKKCVRINNLSRQYSSGIITYVDTVYAILNNTL